MRGALLLCLLTACGRIGFDATGTDAPIVGRWARAATNGNASCAITLTGELWCWGYGIYANLGNGPTVVQDVARVGADSDWTAISVGTMLTCGLRSDGSLWCWGTNERGAVPGTPPDSFVTSPTRIGSGTWKQVAVASRHGCAIDSADVLSCWGEGDLGVTGRGNTPLVAPLAPVAVVGTNRWTAVTTSELTSCGVQSDGSLWCWGYNHLGQVGDGSQLQRNAPVQIGSGRTWTTVRAGSEHTCALEQGGRAWCWGDNYFGQLGDGTATSNAMTSPVAASVVAPLAAIEIGRAHTCGRTSAGETTCWGNGERGQFGSVVTFSPQPISIAAAATDVLAGGDVTCWIDDGAHLWCTGGNNYGQSGGSRGIGLVPVQADTRTDWTGIVARTNHACGTTAGGELSCWGINHFGELGNGRPEDSDTPRTAVGTFTSAALGTYTLGAIGPDQSLWLSGLYPDLTTRQLQPTLYAGAGTTKQVSFGERHGCRILIDDTLSCGGLNNHGQLGDGSTINKESAVVAGLWRFIATGGDTTCGILMTGPLQCWGRNEAGQVGSGPTGDAPAPRTVVLPGATGTAAQVAIGFDFTCAITMAGELYCWGAGSQGQLGNGSVASSTTPVRVGTATTWRTVSAGDAHACALQVDNSLWCWGHGDEGQAGPSLGDPTSPIRLAGDWLDVATGAHFTCAIRTDGTRWCFGSNNHGELGTGAGWREQFVVIP